MQRLMKELGDSINSAITESDQIGRMLLRIKDEGYDVYLVLEATIGDHVLYEERAGAPQELVSMKRENRAPDWPMTAHDARFLKSLHIRVDDQE
jgi:hypothetical protein